MNWSGVKDQSLRQYLIDIANLDLQICIQKAKQYTMQREQVRQMKKNSLATVTPMWMQFKEEDGITEVMAVVKVREVDKGT